MTSATQSPARPSPEKPLIYVTQRIPEAGLSVLEDADLTYEVGHAAEGQERQALLDGLSRCRVVLCLLSERLDRNALEANPHLLGVAQMAVGYDNIDLGAASELGIPVSNTPGVLSEATADFTWALLLAVARRIPEAHAMTVTGQFRGWGPSLMLGADVGQGADGRRRILGILGYGRIGEAVARRATGFGMEILAYSPRSRERIEADPKVRFAELDEIFSRADFVSLHTPLSDETRHLVGEAELRRMKPTAYLINTARGPVVDEVALVRALDQGWIAGAALDVFEREPHLAEGLADLPNVVLCPHIASASYSTRDRMSILAAENAIAHLRGERAPNVLDPAVYDDPAWRRRQAREE